MKLIFSDTSTYQNPTPEGTVSLMYGTAVQLTFECVDEQSAPLDMSALGMHQWKVFLLPTADSTRILGIWPCALHQSVFSMSLGLYAPALLSYLVGQDIFARPPYQPVPPCQGTYSPQLLEYNKGQDRAGIMQLRGYAIADSEDSLQYTISFPAMLLVNRDIRNPLDLQQTLILQLASACDKAQRMAAEAEKAKSEVIQDLSQTLTGVTIDGVLQPVQDRVAELESGSGAMRKAVYDQNNNGVVDDAEHAVNADYATNAGHADTSDTAGSATYATSAGSAASASTAGYATQAGEATNADYATSAGHASTADSATTATSATSATTATNADHATTADSATSAGAVPWSGVTGKPSFDYVPTSEKGAANGVATLDAEGKVSSSELPAMDYIPTSEKGAANGVATLDANGKVPSVELPVAINGGALGAVQIPRPQDQMGILVANGKPYVEKATEAMIDVRTNRFSPIVPSTLDYAVRSVLPNIAAIPAETMRYELLDSSATSLNHAHTYTHSPSSAPTYVLPAVSDTSVTHIIRLIIDFTTVQTYAFVDSTDTAIVPLFTPTIAAGDVYEFRCEYSAMQSRWLIWPVKQGAVSDDYVMQAEVGAANGVATLDASAKVPIAQLHLASTDYYGVVKIYGNGSAYGVGKTANGFLMTVASSKENIDKRADNICIAPVNLNYAVTAALTDANHITLNAVQQSTAQDVIGAAPASLHGSGAPTTSTAGKVGQGYVDDDTQKTYTCTKVTVDETDPQNPITTYTWEQLVVLDANGLIPTEEIPSLSYLPLSGGTVGTLNLQYTSQTANNITALASLCAGYGNVVRSYSNLVVGQNNKIDNAAEDLMVGVGLTLGFGNGGGTVANGQYNLYTPNIYRVVGNGTADANRDNIEELSRQGLLYVAGGYQQKIIGISSSTSAYTLSEGAFSHSPSSAPTYTLPTIYNMIITGGKDYMVRKPSSDGDGYFAWSYTNGETYTGSSSPQVGDKVYVNTSLTGASYTITASDNRTHEIILNVRFSSTALSYAFEDASGNAITPLSTPTVEDGTVISFLCRYEPLLGQWTIMPVVLGKYEVTE